MRRWITAMVVFVLAACGEDEAPIDTGAATVAETGSRDAPPGREDTAVPIEIRFVGTFGDEPAACDVDYWEVGIGRHTVQLVDARFYVSNVRLIRESGEEVSVALTDDDAWQNETTVLIDLEDGTGHCSAANTVETHDSVLGSVPAGTYTKLRFDVGVPHAQNHIDSMLADPPLNETAMFWSWRNGFKFMRIDLAVENGEDTTPWAFHLGSTGFPCSGDAGSVTQPAEEACARPSRPSIELPFDNTSTTIKIDLAALFARSDLGAPADPAAMNPPGCQSFDFDAPDDACRGPFAALGLDVATGRCEADCYGQTVFSIGEAMTATDGEASGRRGTGDSTRGAPPAGTPWAWELPEGFPPPYVPEDNPMTEEKVELGRHLFYDVRLSYNQTQSCSSCHEQARGFADGRITPLGSEGTALARNAQGLANVGYMYPLTWANPKLETLEQQVLVPMLSQEPVELGMTGHEDEILDRLRHEDLYARLFAEAFPRVDDPYSVHYLAQALACFLRALVSVDSPYDRYYAGDDDALGESAKRGIELFFSERLECYHCHGGFAQSQAIRHAKTARPPLAWHNIGLYNLDADGSYPFGNRGVYEMTLDPRDMGAFRPPSLRNVAVTGPYMHDGSVASLDEVLRIYERSGRQIESGALAGDGALNPHKSGLVIGFEITNEERADVIAFFEALTDETFLNDPRFSSPFQ